MYSNPLQILVRRTMALGDVVLITPIVNQLKLLHKEASIDVVTQYVDVFKNNPSVRDVMNHIPQKAYDLIYDLDNVYEQNPKMHIIEAYSRKVFGEVKYDLQPKMYPTSHDRATVANWLSSNNLIGQDIVLIHMRNEPSWPSRHMGAPWWETLCLLLSKLNIPIVQVGRFPDHKFDLPNFYSVPNNFSLQEFTALCDFSKLFVGVDSSLMHIASATDCPIMGIFTSAHHDFRKPLRMNNKFYAVHPKIDCYGCQHDEAPPITNYICRRGDLQCLNLLDTASVYNSIVEVLKQC